MALQLIGRQRHGGAWPPYERAPVAWPVTPDVVAANCARMGLPVPIRLYPFLDATGTPGEVMTRGAATIVGAPGWSQSALGCRYESGGTSYISFEDEYRASLGNQFSAFVVYECADAADAKMVFGNTSLSALQYNWMIYQRSTGFQCYVFSGTGAQTTLNTAPSVGALMAVCMTYDGANIRAYSPTATSTPTAKTGIVGTTDYSTSFGRSAAANSTVQRFYCAGIWREVLSADQARGVLTRWQELTAAPRRALLFDLGGGGGSTYSETVAGTLEFAGAAAAVGVFPRSITDALAISDTVAGIRAIFAEATDALALTGAASGTWTLRGTVTDSLALATALAVLGSYSATVADAISITTSVSATGGAAPELTITLSAWAPTLTIEVH